MQTLRKEERMQLMRFVCSFAWADLEIQDQERAFVVQLMEKLSLNDDEMAQVHEWLQSPPRPEEVDPARIPLKHRKIFLDTVRKVIEADGSIAPDEQENYRLLELMLKA